MIKKIALDNAKTASTITNKQTSASKPGSSANKPSSTAKKRKNRVDSDAEDEVENNKVEEDPESDSSQPAKRQKGRKGDITEQLEKRKRRKKSAKSGLEAFRNSARWITTSWAPSIPWHCVFQVGLEADDIIIKGCMGDLELEKKNIYEILKHSVPSFETEISSILQADALDELISQMSTSGSDAVSQDIRKLKNALLDMIESHRGAFNPPINRNEKKTKSRGWNHLGVARLLCTPSKFAEFDNDPEEFCQRVIDNELESPITASHFPGLFYVDLGEAASKGPEYVFEGLLNSFELYQAWVLIYLAPENASRFAIHHVKVAEGKAEGARFKYLKAGKAWQHGLMTTIRHTLSNSDDIRIDEGSVDKNDAFEAVVALFNDPNLMYPKWIEETLDTWRSNMDWMLPKAKKAPLVNGEDADSSLTQISSVVQRLIARDKAAGNAKGKLKDIVAPSDETDHTEANAIETAEPVEEATEMLTPPRTSPVPEDVYESELSDLDDDSTIQPKASSSKISTSPSPELKSAAPASKAKPKPISVTVPETAKPSKKPSTAKPSSKKTSTAKPPKKNLTTAKTSKTAAK
ncbi:hypothetical protein BDP27DRAFT_1475508 [Rhodocollybia butyracea]|uniref:Uncharacterized protein n=1 Tax=Rhodocollybia butyracea TaxID=206335 RepID=A0A9P5PES2_9AGAR|nr:hypothetical protein BDP27DRAFT_1475508 [Rhodocollybia butyracea]